MSKIVAISKDRPTGGVANIATLDVVSATLEKLINRRQGVPGIGVLYGPSGWGKSFSANMLASDSRAYYVQMAGIWQPKDMLGKVLAEMGMTYHQSATAAKLLDLVSGQLSASKRTLIIDEFDYATEKVSLLKLTRDIYEQSQGSLLLIGEERLPRKLEEWEHFHNRVLTWAPAQKVSFDDAVQLAAIYCPKIALADDVTQSLVDRSKGSVRRVVTCLTAIYEHALLVALDEVNLKALAKIVLPNDRASERRV